MSELPTTEDFHKLPLRGLVAYAVRAAMRSRPRFQIAEALERVDDAITAAVSFAANVDFDLVKARAAEEAVIEAVRLASDPEKEDRGSALAANVAYAAVNAAVSAAEVEGAKNPIEAAQAVVAAAVTATEAAKAVHPRAKDGLAKDFAALVNHTHEPFPQLGSPINVGPNGPLGKLACKPLPGRKGPAPNHVDLLEILRLRDEMESENANVEQVRRTLEDERAAIAREFSELEELRQQIERQKGELEASRADIAQERSNVQAFARDLWDLMGRHGLVGEAPPNAVPATEGLEESTPDHSVNESHPDEHSPAAEMVQAVEEMPVEAPVVEEPSVEPAAEKVAKPARKPSPEDDAANAVMATIDSLLAADSDDYGDAIDADELVTA